MRAIRSEPDPADRGQQEGGEQAHGRCRPSCRLVSGPRIRNLTCKRIQVDEIWAFVYAKQKNVPLAKKAPPQAGDAWTWTAIDADTKLIPSWHVGGRDSDAAIIFMDDLASRLANRVQLTSDGHRAYLEAVEGGSVAILITPCW